MFTRLKRREPAKKARNPYDPKRRNIMALRPQPGGKPAETEVKTEQPPPLSASVLPPPEEQPQKPAAVPMVQVPGGPPAELMEMAGADAGKGVSTEAADNIVPMIVVLNALSPQVDESGPAYIQGAKQGMIWLRNSSVGIISGQEGFTFQPCHFEKMFPEWVHRDLGGGLVARHKIKSASSDDIARIMKTHEGPGVIDMGEDIPDIDFALMRFRIEPTTRQKIFYKPGTGQPMKENEYKLTRYHSGYVDIDEYTHLPYVIPFTGSGHAVSKAWMFNIMSKRLPNGQPYPSWAAVYRIKTKQRTNAKGQKWYVLDPMEGSNEGKTTRWVDTAGYRRGKELHDAFASGQKQAEAETIADEAEHAASGNYQQDQGANSARMTEEIPY